MIATFNANFPMWEYLLICAGLVAVGIALGYVLRDAVDELREKRED